MKNKLINGIRNIVSGFELLCAKGSNRCFEHFYLAKPSASNICLVTSTIYFGSRALSYSDRRSYYSPKDRLVQTLTSLESVRLKIPNCMIVLLENSELTDNDKDLLGSKVDMLACFNNDRSSIALRDGPYKGAAEVYMISKVLEVLKHTTYMKIFKLSGRYYLDDRFDVDNFPADKFGVLLTEGVYSTRLYSVPKILENCYSRQLELMLRKSKKGASIESVLMRGLSKDIICALPYTGVQGYIGVNGELIRE